MALSRFCHGLSIFADTWETSGAITLKPSGDTDNYISFETAANVVVANFAGAASLKSSGDFNFSPSGLADSFEIGRGDTDTDITFQRSHNADGEDVWIHGNATQDAVSIASTKP